MSKAKIVPLRVTSVERVIIGEAAKAMGINVSNIFENGAVEAAHRLGFFAGPGPSIRKRSWKDAPVRGDESASERLSVSMNAENFDLVSRAADWVGASVPLFLIGATLRYIANRRAGSPENRRLQRLELPPQYS